MLRRLALAAAGALLLLGAAEVLLRLLPVSTATEFGYHVDPLILTYPPGHRWQVATGWDLRNPQRLQANNFGFASTVDYQPGSNAVALIGDSFVEASMLDESDRSAAQFARAAADGRPVYSLAIPGSSLLDYAERIRFASERLGVRDFVVLMEAGDVGQALCGSGNVHGPCLDARTLQPQQQLRAAPTALKRVLRHSALLQYLLSQIKLDGRRLWRQALASAAPPSPEDVPEPGVAGAAALPAAAPTPVREEMVRAVTKAFFERVRPYATGRLVLMVDGRRGRAALAAPREAGTDILRERDRFLELARAEGAQVIDAEDVYRAHWAASELSIEVGPYDRHLNALGLQLMMGAGARALR
ncbi:hypothetical protein HLB44_05865 [Aquincola sp. S2]|uniref:SGNH/GDSL hydrolase family protein n=1 Tax=Pseudaquabacterium terrae TaxID=2732868 RepID=A0ABX2ECH9_9BURK|nr:hypothetical protein [Aquabacterium terrae]NRF66502.1 hypothetical protein [Aquabacterium terrae]